MLSFQMPCKSTQKRIFFIIQMELEVNQERCHDVEIEVEAQTFTKPQNIQVPVR